MSDKEFNELVYYVSAMKQQMNRQEHIIDMQNNRIEELGRVIDELAWQLRDLRSAVREVRDVQKKQTPKGKIYENAEQVSLRRQALSSSNRNYSMRPGSSLRLSSATLNDGEELYEPIMFPRRDYIATSDSMCNRLSILSSVPEDSQEESEKPSQERASSLETLFRTFKVGSTLDNPIDTGGLDKKEP
ncbi:hypothetical protein DMENIID0001_096620 [Sergentomyia squamirostris]